MKSQPSFKKSASKKAPAERVVKDLRRQTRRHFSDEDKIRIVLDGLRGEYSISEALADRPSAPSRVWNRIAPEVQYQIVEMALDYSEPSARGLTVRLPMYAKALCPKPRSNDC
jgi:transposase